MRKEKSSALKSYRCITSCTGFMLYKTIYIRSNDTFTILTSMFYMYTYGYVVLLPLSSWPIITNYHHRQHGRIASHYVQTAKILRQYFFMYKSETRQINDFLWFITTIFFCFVLCVYVQSQKWISSYNIFRRFMHGTWHIDGYSWFFSWKDFANSFHFLHFFLLRFAFLNIFIQFPNHKLLLMSTATTNKIRFTHSLKCEIHISIKCDDNDT